MLQPAPAIPALDSFHLEGPTFFDIFEDASSIRSEDWGAAMTSDGELVDEMSRARCPDEGIEATRARTLSEPEEALLAATANGLCHQVFGPLSVIRANVDLLSHLLSDLRVHVAADPSIGAILDELATLIGEAIVCCERIQASMCGFRRLGQMLSSTDSGAVSVASCVSLERQSV